VSDAWRLALISPLAVVMVSALTAASCSRSNEEEGEQPVAEARSRVDPQGRVVLNEAERQALDLATIAVERKTLETIALRFGKVGARPQEEALVVAPVTARLAAPPAITLSSQVKAGVELLQLVPLVDSASRADLGAQRRELQGQAIGARARVQALESELERTTTLVASELATEADRMRAQAELSAERARLESLNRASGELARVTQGKLVLRAPVSGQLVQLQSDVGAPVEQGAVIARILQRGPRWVDVAVAPGDEIGTSYRVRVGSTQLDARLISRGAVVDPDGTRRDRVEIDAAQVERVLPGATVPVEVVRRTEGVVVPESAVTVWGEKLIVFVEVENGKFEARPIAVGARAKQRVAVSRGLSVGEKIVIRGAASLLGEVGPVAPSPAASSR
jgi:membrane fusion protein, heavy metal efflux system